MSSIPTRDIQVLIHPSSKQSAGSIACVLDRDLKIIPDVIAEYCFSDLTPIAFDLALVAGGVAFADRAVPRALSLGWPRHLRLTIPVISERWRRPQVQASLLETLHLLTGDFWDIRFRLNRRRLERSKQSVLKLQHAGAVAMPYSDGLDSFAGGRFLQRSLEPNDGTLILITTGAHSDVDKMQSRRRVRVRVPFGFSEAHSNVRLREPSYRSRAFVFGALAGLAVNLAGGTSVVIPESGQSSLGPALCPVGGEALDIRSHPRFTEKLGSFLSLLLDAPITFEHPRLWYTKGETLAELKAIGLLDGWQDTKSCPRSARHVALGGAKVHCGVCAACLLRRQSLFAARVDEREEYQWPNLKKASLADAAADGARETNTDDYRHVACGVLCMEYFARLLDSSSGDGIRQAVADMPRSLGTDLEIEHKLKRLIIAHKTEWHAFTLAQGKQSLINDLLGKII